MKIIDPHLHLFDLNKGKYAWLKPHNPPYWSDKEMINKDFSENELQLNQGLLLAGFVHIEAGFNNEQPWQEITWLEKNCRLPFKSIAGIDLTLNSEQFLQAIIKLKSFSSVVGVRDILDDQAVEYLSNKQVKSNLEQLAEHQLIFELQMPINNLNAVELFIKILQKTPNLQVVINHAGSPNTLCNKIDLNNNWQQGLEKLSIFQQCSIKCSGFEMTNRNYSVQYQADIITRCIEHFDIERVMLASNFPLCLFTKTYQGYWQNYLNNELLSFEKLNYLCFLNAKRIYQL